MNERLMKPTKMPTALAIENTSIPKTEYEAVESEESQIKKVDMKTLAQTCFYPECNSKVQIKNWLSGVIVVRIWH